MMSFTKLPVYTAIFSLVTFGWQVAADEIPSDAPRDDLDHSFVVGDLGPGMPQHHFQIACLNCRNGDRGVAAREIRKGAQLLREQAKRATAKGKAVLDRSSRELENLAGAVQKGAAVSIEKIKATFARAQHALAYHHHTQASDSWARRKFKQAGKQFKAAAYNIEYGLSWIGEGVETKGRDVIIGTRDLGSALIDGTKIGAGRVKTQTKALGQEIERFGRRIVKPVRR